MHFLALATLLIWMSPFPDSLVYSVWIAPRLAVNLDGQGGYTGEGNDIPLQYSCLENSMDGGATVHGVANELDMTG